MSDDFQLVRYKKSEKEAVFAFLRTVHPSIPGDRLTSQWDWKYDANPFNRESEPYILLVKDEARIVGIQGSIPVRVSINGEERWAMCGGDLVLHPDYRGLGISRWIIRQSRADHPVIFGWINEMSHRALAHVITARCGRVTLLVSPLNWPELLWSGTGNRWLSRWGGRLAAAGQRLMRPRRTPPRLADVTISQIETFDEGADLFWRRVCRSYPVVVVRDQRYLNWRFVARPDATYTLLVATCGSDVVGYLILRSAEKDGVRWGYLVDFLVEGPSPSLLALLIDEAVERLRKERAVAVMSFASAPAYQRALSRQGFYLWPWGSRASLYTRVEPPDPTWQAFQDVRQSFWTMGDGDLEMAF
jgi:GNAT superfamily N-acetyltransferase